MDNGLAAVVESAHDGGTIFAYLKEGERFIFTLSLPGDPVLVKGKAGWYRRADGTGRALRTGRYTRVYRVGGQA